MAKAFNVCDALMMKGKKKELNRGATSEIQITKEIMTWMTLICSLVLEDQYLHFLILVQDYIVSTITPHFTRKNSSIHKVGESNLHVDHYWDISGFT